MTPGSSLLGRGFGEIFGIWGMGCCLDGDLGGAAGLEGKGIVWTGIWGARNWFAP